MNRDWTLISVDTGEREANIEYISETMKNFPCHIVKCYRAADREDWNEFVGRYPEFKIDEFQLKPKFLHYSHRRLGEIGCWMSHYSAWNYILENDLDSLLLIEDDCIIDDELIEMAFDIVKDYDMAILGQWSELTFVRKNAAQFLIDNYLDYYRQMGIDRYLAALNQEEKLNSVNIQITRQLVELYPSRIDHSGEKHDNIS